MVADALVTQGTWQQPVYYLCKLRLCVSSLRKDWKQEMKIAFCILLKYSAYKGEEISFHVKFVFQIMDKFTKKLPRL